MYSEHWAVFSRHKIFRTIRVMLKFILYLLLNFETIKQKLQIKEKETNMDKNIFIWKEKSL